MTVLSDPSAQARSARGLEALLDLLDLEQVEVDLFRSGRVGQAGVRLFGGQVAAQAMVAAERSLGEAHGSARPHSLHAYFLRPGDTGKRVAYRVDRPHDGRTFQRRRVTAIQDGAVILALESSFTTDRSSAERQPAAPVVPDPEACPLLDWTPVTARPQLTEAFELRTVPEPDGSDGPDPLVRDLWFRSRGSRADERASGSAVLTYISDLTLVSALLRGAQRPEGTRLTSMDHALWFHREVVLDDWLLYAKNTVAAGPLRGLVQGGIFGRDGMLIATVMQEGLIHPPR